MEISGSNRPDAFAADQRSHSFSISDESAQMEMDPQWGKFCDAAKLGSEERRELRECVDRVKAGSLTDLSVAGAFVTIMTADYLFRGIGSIESFCAEVLGWHPDAVEENCDSCLSTVERDKQNADRLRQAAAASKDLSKGQRAALGADLLEMLSDDAKKRKDQTSHLDRDGQGRLVKKPHREKFPDVEESKAKRPRDLLGAELGVNPRYISEAHRIKAVAPETFAAIKNGRITIQAAKSQIENTAVRPLVPMRKV
jgi:hypothetical protein